MGKEIIKLALPICYSSLLSVVTLLINMKIIGEQDPFAYYIMGLFTSINYLIIALFESIRALIVSSIIHHTPDEIPYFLNAVMFWTLIIFMSMSVILKCLQHAFFIFLHIPLVAQSCFMRFGLMMILGSFSACCTYILMSVFYAKKKGNLLFLFSSISAIGNMTITWIFVNKLHMGLYSLPLALIVTNFFLFTNSYLLIIAVSNFSIKFKINRKMLKIVLKQYIKIGLPVLVSYLMISIGTFIFSILLSKQSSNVVSGFGIAYRLQILFILPAIAIGAATAIHYNHFLQNGDANLGKKSQAIGLSCSFLIYTIFSIFFYLTKSKWVHFIVNNSDISEAVMHYLKIVIPSYSFFALFITYIVFCEQTSRGIKGLIMNGLYFMSIFYLQTRMELFSAIAMINTISGCLLLPYLFKKRKGKSYVSVY